MLTESQWQHVMDNLGRIKSNVQENMEDGMMADEKFNCDFADHVTEYLHWLAGAIQMTNKTCTEWKVVEL